MLLFTIDEKETLCVTERVVSFYSSFTITANLTEQVSISVATL